MSRRAKVILDAVAISALYPCRYRGERTGDTVPSRMADEASPLDVYSCIPHGRCTLGRANGLWSCQHCAERDAHPTTGAPDILPGVPDPLPEPVRSPSPPGWYSRPEVMDRHAIALAALVEARIGPTPEGEGDGIVLCGGGRYWPMLCVALRMIRRVTNLPIRVYHRGEAEPVRPGNVSDLSAVSYHDLTKLGPYRRLVSWEAKTCALIDAPFERTLFLDADAYPVSDIRPLFDLCDRSTPFVFWENEPFAQIQCNLKALGLAGREVPCIQGGQFVVSAPYFWRTLIVAHWLNQHSDYYYHYGYGDQDMWRIALNVTQGEYLNLGKGIFDYKAWVGCLSSTPVIVHRVCAKWWGAANDPKHAHLPGEEEAWAARDGLQTAPSAARKTFGHILAGKGDWGPPGASGPGSTLAASREYVAFVQGWAAGANILRAVDLGCGDGVVLRSIGPLVKCAVDCHSDTIKRLKSEDTSREYLCLDLDTDRERLPTAPLALLKDVLLHWPLTLVVDWLVWAVKSGKWQTLLICQDEEGANVNSEITLGGWRPLKLDEPPFGALPARRLFTYGRKTIWSLPCGRF